VDHWSITVLTAAGISLSLSLSLSTRIACLFEEVSHVIVCSSVGKYSSLSVAGAISPENGGALPRLSRPHSLS